MDALKSLATGPTEGAEHLPAAAATHEAGLPVLKPIFFGVLASIGLLTLYLGTITLAQSWEHALQQLGDDLWFVGAITLGFGIQVGLFTYLRALRAHTGAGGMVASTGTSTVAMLACCAHHLTEVLPLIGLSGVAVFLNAYKTPLLWLGLVMNLGGIAYMAYQIRKERRLVCRA
ncbi:MAG: hypothetical protein IVW55_05160 [Chloroflexi bacterium]|nr:hypothetical protein [Chloroflexota bacterium]